MKEKIVDSVVDEVVSRVFEFFTPKTAAAFAAAVGAVGAFFRNQILSPLKDHWWLFLLVALTFLCAGFLAGWARRGVRLKKAADKAAYEAVVEEEKTVRDAREMFMRALPWMKELFYAAHEKGGAYCQMKDWHSLSKNQADFMLVLVQANNLSGNVTQFTERPVLARLFKEHGDLFDAVKEKAVAKHAVYDPDKEAVPRRTAPSGELLWWWYTDDEPQYETLPKERKVFVDYTGQA